MLIYKGDDSAFLFSISFLSVFPCYHGIVTTHFNIMMMEEDRKGSLFLRSNWTEYGPNVLVSNWDQRREAEPKDYDYTGDNRRNCHLSTYKRFGTNEVCPSTSYQHLCQNLNLKPLYEEKKPHDPFHSLQSGTNFRTEHPSPFKCGCKLPFDCECILPKHPPDYNKRYFETTHLTDYKPPYPYSTKTERFIPDNSAAFKRCLSQFTDPDGHRRTGQNTWFDESGIYGNRLIKSNLYEATLPELRPETCTHVPNHGNQCGEIELRCKH